MSLESKIFGIVFVGVLLGVYVFALWPWDDGHGRYSESRQVLKRAALEGFRRGWETVRHIIFGRGRRH